MIKYVGKSTTSKKDEAIKREDMKIFAREQFSALTKKHIMIPFSKFQL